LVCTSDPTCSLVFLLDFAAERYVEKKYDMPHSHSEGFIKEREGSGDAAMLQYNMSNRIITHQQMHSGDQNEQTHSHSNGQTINKSDSYSKSNNDSDVSTVDQEKQDAFIEYAFRKQIAAFLILEFGVIFHSVIIGLTLATSDWDDFKILYAVIVFHQSFEGMGIGARLSAIPFPKRLSWMPWFLCTGYGLTTPIAIAVGLGVRTTYDAGSYTANVVSGVLDATSAGILLYSGFVEFLARDFLFNPERTKDDRQLTFMCVCVVLGAGLMALLGECYSFNCLCFKGVMADDMDRQMGLKASYRGCRMSFEDIALDESSLVLLPHATTNLYFSMESVFPFPARNLSCLEVHEHTHTISPSHQHSMYYSLPFLH
jgi:zinc transporter 1/2/3